MRGNASILWASPPRIELVSTPDPEVWPDALAHGEWDGPLLRVVRYTDRDIAVVPSSYGHLAAARRGLGLTDPLFLAVTGITVIEGGVVLGKRASSVADSGAWEFAPSGGVQGLPIENQIRTEATEELGITSQSISVGNPAALFVDASAFTADIVIPLQVNISIDEFLRNFSTGEYDEIEVVPMDQVRGFLLKQSLRCASVTNYVASLISSEALALHE